MRWLALLLLAMAALPPVAAAEPVRIGSKQFTESVILGEVARISADEAGIAAVHKRELGGTSILWAA
ncbi:MAG: glycine betaine ABC transporter substrate-binding protein, partial [Rhodanobacter sp.]